MTVDWNFQAFSDSEHRSRIDGARTVMGDEGLDACVCTSPELLYYFTGYEAHTHHAIGSQALVLTADGNDPILILRDGDVPQADETIVVGEIRPFRLGASDLGQLVGNALSAQGVLRGHIGLDLSGPTMNGALAQSIRSAIQSDEIHDCWRMLGKLRTVLSEAEISYLREATHFANVGIDEFYAKARVGISEVELAAEIEYAMRSIGSDYAAVPTWMASGERAYCQHAMASRPETAAGRPRSCRVRRRRAALPVSHYGVPCPRGTHSAYAADGRRR